MVGSGGGACTDWVEAAAAGVFNQLIRSSALRPAPDNTGTESTKVAAKAPERPVLEGTTMVGAETTAK